VSEFRLVVNGVVESTLTVKEWKRECESACVGFRLNEIQVESRSVLLGGHYTFEKKQMESVIPRDQTESLILAQD
jgi:hypothetical protein